MQCPLKGWTEDVPGRKQFLTCVYVLIIACVPYAGFVESADKKPIERDWREMNQRTAETARELFGSRAEFERLEVIRPLSLVCPAPVQARLPLNGRQIDPVVRKWSLFDFNRIWFSKEWAPAPEDLMPKEYFLRASETDPLDDSLYYAWSKNGIDFRASETSSGLLMEVENPAFNFKRGVAGQNLDKMLREILNVPAEFYDWEVGDMRVVDLKVPDLVRAGMCFGNLKTAEHLQFIKRWYFGTVIIATDRSVTLVVVRPDRRGPRGEMGQQGIHWPDARGYFEYPGWLQDAIFEADGKTPVNPKPERNERDEP